MSREINSLGGPPTSADKIKTHLSDFSQGLNRAVWKDDGYFWHFHSHTAAGTYLPQTPGQQTIINGEEQYHLKDDEITGAVSHWPNNRPDFIRNNALVLSAIPLSDATQYNDIAYGVVENYSVVRSTSNTVTVFGRNYYDRRITANRWGINRYLTDGRVLRIVSNGEVYDVTGVITNDTVDPDGTSGPTEHTITISGTFATQPTPAQTNGINLLRQQKYLSRCFTTRNTFAQQYGAFLIRCKVPKGEGCFPAAWLYSPFNGFPGTEDIDEDDKKVEHDLLEALGHATDISYKNLHSPGQSLQGFFSSNTPLDHSNATPTTAGWTSNEIQQHQVIIDSAHPDFHDPGAEMMEHLFLWFPPADKNNPYGPSSVAGEIGNTGAYYVKRDSWGSEWSDFREVQKSYMTPRSFSGSMDALMLQMNMSMESDFNYDQEINDAGYVNTIGATAAPWEFEIEKFEVWQWLGEIAGGAGIHDVNGQRPNGFSPTPGDTTQGSGGGVVEVSKRRIISKPVIGLDGAVEFSLSYYLPGETYDWQKTSTNSQQIFVGPTDNPTAIIRAVGDVVVPTTDDVTVGINTVALPRLTAPLTITDAITTFEYEPGGVAVTAWEVFIGQTDGGTEYLDSGVVASNILSVTNTTEIPQNGSVVYVHLRYRTEGVWHHVTTTFNAPQSQAGTITFNPIGVDGYLSNSEQDDGINLTGTFTGMPVNTVLNISNPGGALTFDSITVSGNGSWSIPLTPSQAKSFPVGLAGQQTLTATAAGNSVSRTMSRWVTNPVCDIIASEVGEGSFTVQVTTDSDAPDLFDLELTDSNGVNKHTFAQLFGDTSSRTFNGSASLAETINSSDQWKARVTDEYGNFGELTEVVQLEGVTGPSIVQDLTVVENSPGLLTLEWEWDETTNGQLEYGTTSALGSLRQPTEDTFDQYSSFNQWLSADDHGLQPGVTYFLRAKGTNESGGTSYTSTIQVTTVGALAFDSHFPVEGANIINKAEGESGLSITGDAAGYNGQTISFTSDVSGMVIADAAVTNNKFTMVLPSVEILKSAVAVDQTITATRGSETATFVYQYHDFIPIASAVTPSYTPGQAFPVEVTTTSNRPPYVFGLEVKRTTGETLLSSLMEDVLSKPVTFNITSGQTSGWPGAIDLDLYSENVYRNGATVTKAVSSSSVLSCMGIDLYSTIVNGYTKPPKVLKTPTQVFSTWNAALDHLNSQQDHGGNVYQVTGGNYTTSTGNYRVSNARNFTLTCDPANPAVMTSNDNAHTGVEFELCDNFEISNFEFHGYTSFAIAVGFYFPTRPGSTHGLILNNYIHDIGQAGVTLRGNSSDITVEGNEIANIGTGADGAGEGIYLGVGSTGGEDQYVERITIRGNHIHDCSGEAIDIKRDTRDVDCHYNVINNNDVKSQGAITVLLNEGTGFDGNVDIYRNIILNTTTREYDGNAITIAFGQTIVRENIIAGTAAHAIDIYDDFSGTNDECIIERNVIWDYNGLPVRQGVGNSAGGVNPANVVRNNNVVESDAVNTDCVETSAVFVGPLGNADYDAGSGPGSAFAAS